MGHPEDLLEDSIVRVLGQYSFKDEFVGGTRLGSLRLSEQIGGHGLYSREDEVAVECFELVFFRV